MTTLLIHHPDSSTQATDQTVFGGQPSAPPDTVSWPTCRECDGPMQFQGQIRTSEDELLLLFMCQNEPGACEDWDADEGANKAIAVSTHHLQLLQPPDHGQTLRETRYGAQPVQIQAADYDAAGQQWSSQNQQPQREVLGQQGGEPAWLQNDETPDCDHCNQPMEFVAQLEQGPDWKTEMNFGGGGCAYVFRCGCAGPSAKWLWQC